MRKFAILLVILLTICGRNFAISWQPVSCDSSSFVYYSILFGSDSLSNGKLTYWENLVDFCPKPTASQESSPTNNNNNNSSDCRVLFTLPDDFLNTPNPEYKKVKHDKLEFYSKHKSDETSHIYMCPDVDKLSHSDSALLYLPFDTRNLDVYTVKAFGIKAKYVEIDNPLPPHFHIDISDNPIKEHYPWNVVLPIALGILLIILANVFQDGYVRRVFIIETYYNAFLNSVSERNVNADKSSWLLFINYLINATLFAFIVLYRYNYQFTFGFVETFSLMILTVLMVFLIKYAISFVFAYLFNCLAVCRLHYSNLSFLMQITGVFLLLVNIISLYVNNEGVHDMCFYITLLGLGVAEISKIFRLIKIIIGKHFSFFYLFLYLCAVEFLPVFLVVKTLSL